MSNEICRSAAEQAEQDLIYSLSTLKGVIDDRLEPADDGRRQWSKNYLSVTEKDGEYSLSYGEERTLCLEFGPGILDVSGLYVSKAEINWVEGDIELKDESQEATDAALADLRRQEAAGLKILRFGDENFAFCTRQIDPDELPGFVDKILTLATRISQEAEQVFAPPSWDDES